METENRFSIDAKTYALKYNSQQNGGTVFGNNTKYIIPIYQRPYSWTEEQIRKILSDIFLSYWGSEGKVVEEPMFVGTMQLSVKSDRNEQDIIDGQQRLTTFLILIKVLQQKFPENAELNTISLDWLSTKVNNGKQQEYLLEIIQSDLTFNDETLNPYLKNAFLINEIIEEEMKDEEGNEIAFEVDRFVKYLLSSVYFVVIETRSGLSKTLQIFNAINTTGLDLNGGDIFKIRMYEYLRDKKGKDETAFDEVSRLYQMIDHNNSKLGDNVADINDILNTYQFILISKYNLPATLYTYATNTFFERLFDTISNIHQWEHFKNNVNAIDLSLGEIERVIEVRYEWENSNYLTAEDACAMHFIWWSRYGRYWAVIFVFLYKFKDEEDHWNKMLLFTRQLGKLYTIYSIKFLKSINEMHAFTYALIKDINNKSFDEIIAKINQKIGKALDQKDFENTLNGDITYNTKIKKIICRLSAMLDEDYETDDIDKIEAIRKGLFDSAIDVEHIQSYHDINGDKRDDIWEEWQENINSIGNLMILEQGINRSISNSSYEIKRESYPLSIYAIVKKQVETYSEWTLLKSLERKKTEIDKILQYLFKNLT